MVSNRRAALCSLLLFIPSMLASELCCFPPKQEKKMWPWLGDSWLHRPGTLVKQAMRCWRSTPTNEDSRVFTFLGKVVALCGVSGGGAAYKHAYEWHQLGIKTCRCFSIEAKDSLQEGLLSCQESSSASLSVIW